MAYQQAVDVQQTYGQVRPQLEQPEKSNTMYVQQDPQVLVSQQEATDSSQDRPNFSRNSQKASGIYQIGSGLALIILGCIGYNKGTPTVLNHIGLCCGPCMIAAGTLGIVSARNQETCSIVSCMAMSIIASVSAFFYIFFSALAYCMEIASFTLEGRMHDWRLGVACLGVIVGTGEMFIAMLQLVVCCRAVCCIGIQFSLQTQGYVQAAHRHAGIAQFSVLQPGGSVYPAGTAFQPGYNQVVQHGLPPQPVNAAQQYGPVQPPPYSQEGAMPLPYEEQYPGT